MHTLRSRAIGASLAVSLFVTALVAATPLAASAAPGGGSIVYVFEHNVWIADGDGGSRRQVTTGGTASDPWRTPTQADDGTVAAVKGALVYRMNQWGGVLNTLDVPALFDVQGNLVDQAPSKIALSPDGKRLAYTLEKFTFGGFGGWQLRQTTSFTSTTSVSSPDTWGVTYNDNPSWVTDNRVLVEGDIERIRYVDLGQGENFWFDEDSVPGGDNVNLMNPVLSRDGTHVATVRGYFDESHIALYRTSGNVKDGPRPPIPEPQCYTSSGPGFDDPVFSPDSTQLGWSEPDGIWTVAVPAGDCTGASPRLILAGGSEPDWSAAAIQTTPPPTDSTATPTANPSTHPAPGGVVITAKKLTAKKKPSIAGTAKVGNRLSVKKGAWSVKPKKYRYQWLRDGKKIAKATKATYRVTVKDRGHRISVKVTAIRKGYVSTSYTSKKVTVKR